jgi:hypothetical protein
MREEEDEEGRQNMWTARHYPVASTLSSAEFRNLPYLSDFLTHDGWNWNRSMDGRKSNSTMPKRAQDGQRRNRREGERARETEKERGGEEEDFLLKACVCTALVKPRRRARPAQLIIHFPPTTLLLRLGVWFFSCRNAMLFCTLV